MSKSTRRAQERSDPSLGTNEWWIADLAQRLRMTSAKLANWARRGWIHSRRSPIRRAWIIWADTDEIVRLRQLRTHSRPGVTQHPAALTTPKSRPNH